MTVAERAVLASMRGGQAWVAALYVASDGIAKIAGKR